MEEGKIIGKQYRLVKKIGKVLLGKYSPVKVYLIFIAINIKNGLEVAIKTVYIKLFIFEGKG